MRIQEALEKFLIQLKADGRSQHTIRQYARHVHLFAHWAHEVGHSGKVMEITHEDLARFLSSPGARTRKHGGLKKATSVNTLRSTLKGFFGYLHKAGYITQDPSRLIRRALCGVTPPRTLNKSEIKRLMDVFLQGRGPEAKRDFALFHMMLETGVRLSSSLALDIQDVDLERGELWLRTTKNSRPEKTFLSSKIIQHLYKYISDRKHGPLFPNQYGKRLSVRHVQRRFNHWLEKAGIKNNYSCHSLRHSFATNLYKKTHDLFLVQRALNHRSIVSTLTYAHVDEDRLRLILQS